MDMVKVFFKHQCHLTTRPENEENMKWTNVPNPLGFEVHALEDRKNLGIENFILFTSINLVLNYPSQQEFAFCFCRFPNWEHHGSYPLTMFVKFCSTLLIEPP